MSQKFSILYDVMKLADSLDQYTDQIRGGDSAVTPAAQAAEALRLFDIELQKEAKNSSALTPFINQFGTHSKLLQQHLTSKQVDESVALAKSLAADLAKLQIVLAQKQKEK
jgi:hypothetical protein